MSRFNAVAATTGAPVGSYFYGRNQLGSIINVTDGTGQSRAVYSYDPYGQRYQVSGDVTADFGYTGLFPHANSGLDFAIYRVYDPSSKLWLSRDPIGEKGGINLYGYLGNDPVDGIDPLGLDGLLLLQRDGNRDSPGTMRSRESGSRLYIAQRR
jgi:RHS repeat-associated protein